MSRPTGLSAQILRYLILLVLLGTLPTAPAVAQSGDGTPRFSVVTSVDGWFPTVLDQDAVLSYAVGGTAELAFAPLPFADASIRVGAYSLQVNPTGSLMYVGGAVGLGARFRLTDRWSIRAGGFAGLGHIPNLDGERYGLYDVGAHISASARITPSLSVDAFGGVRRLGVPSGSLSDSLFVGAALRLVPGELLQRQASLAFERIETQKIFPVLRSWYDDQPLGTVTVRNNEDGPIQDVRLRFFVPQYMGGPRLCADIDQLARGESVDVPLYAVFDERVLSLTEGVSTVASVDAEYSFLGRKRVASESVTVSFYHRNAMSWADDRRAAAFVSPTDPSALWFARYASSIVRDRMRDELPQNLQIALGVFEALRLYGLNYVIDPNSAYIDMSENAEYVDYLQYPGQTLMFRGGDCDDLSILYSSLLESLGIATAFITIPGHIYMAFDTGLSEEQARDQFFDPGLLLYRDGKAWAPVEITMVNEGFVKAWRVGAKQWIDGTEADTAAILTMRENWSTYQPSGLQAGNARFELPDDSAIMTAFDDAVDRFMLREFGPVMAQYRAELEADPSPETRNRYGISLARVGLLDEAWAQFSAAADEEYAWAWNNLANVAFIRGDYELARSYYEWSESLLPGDPVALLGIARASYELDLYRDSEEVYGRLETVAPALAADYGYLASIYGGSGRAWSMTDRLSRTIWSEPGLEFGPTPAVAQAPTRPVQPVPPAEPEPEPEPEPAEEPEPSAAEPEPATEPPPVVQEDSEPEPVAAAEPAAEPEWEPGPQVVAKPGPEPAPEPISVAETAPAEPEPTDVAETAPVEPEPDPAAVVQREPEPEPVAEPEPAPQTTRRPPAIAQRAPADADIAAATSRVTQPTDANTAAARERVQPPQVAAAPAEEGTAQPAVATPAARANAVAPPAREVTAEEPVLPTESAPEPQPEPAPVETPEPVVLNLPPLVAPVDVEPVVEPVVLAALPMRDPVQYAPQPTVMPPLPVRAPVRVEPDPVPEPIRLGALRMIPPVSYEPVAEPVEVRVPPLPTPVRMSPPPDPTVPERPHFDWVSEGSPLVLRRYSPWPAPESQIMTPETVDVEVGSWDLGGPFAFMTDELATFAKAVIAPDARLGPTAYEFSARSAGHGVVGFGLHLHGRGEWKLTGYGGGDSLLFWVTRDREYFGDGRPRVQVYRSLDEVNMRLLASTPIDGSVDELRAYRMEYEPESGILRVAVDGGVVLKVFGLWADPEFDYAALRARDLTQFFDLRIMPLGDPGDKDEASP